MLPALETRGLVATYPATAWPGLAAGPPGASAAEVFASAAADPQAGKQGKPRQAQQDTPAHGPLRLHFPDVSLAPGGSLLLRGPSGSGKSTWLALVAGLLPVADGELWVAGQRLKGMGPAALDRWRARQLGFLPQGLHLSAALTVADNLALAYFAQGLAVQPAAIHSALAALGVADLARRKPAQLSGGQAQRVALARATVLRPQLILADEPTASLDDGACALALSALRDSAAACGAALVLATHDARVAQAWPQAQTLDLSAAAVSLGGPA